MIKTEKGHILVVDDDPQICDVLKSMLQVENYKVAICNSAGEALTAIKNDQFSCMLIDVFLPDMDGIDLIAKIREEKINTPIIVITGSSEVEIARKAIKYDIFDYLIKPFKNKHLLQIVHNAVVKNRLEEERTQFEGQRQAYQEELEKMVRIKSDKLDATENRYRNLIEQSLVGVFVQEDEHLIFVNRKLCELLECTADLIYSGKRLIEYVHKDDLDNVQMQLQIAANQAPASTSMTFRIITAKGNERLVETWAQFSKNGAQNVLQGLMLDVTEQKSAKERERHLQLQLLNEHKLSAIGRLTAGISHNLNTPISIIQGNAELLKLRHPELKEIDIILRQTVRMTDIIKTISKKGQDVQNARVVKIDLNKLLQDELDFLNANLFYKHHVTKQIELDPDLPPIEGQYSDFSQGLLHIIQNAIDAVYDRETRVVGVQTSFDDQAVFVKISDSGCGISSEERGKIFSPFYTSKPTQAVDNDPNKPRGTGLGLSLARSSLEPYGAQISFESEVDKGTTFTIRIPRPVEESEN